MSVQVPTQDIAQLNIQIKKQTPRTLDNARNIVLDWVAQAIGRPMKRSAHSGEPFRMHAENKVVIATAGRTFWAMTLHQLTEEGHPYATDVCLRYCLKDKLFLNTKITLHAEDQENTLLWSVPNFVPKLADKVGLLDAGQSLQDEPVHLVTDGGAQKLYDVIFNASRTLPVIVVTGMSLRAPKRFVFPTDPDPLAQRLYGIAPVYTVNDYVHNQFAKLVPKEWSLQRGSVRCYRPCANLAQTDVFHAHPYNGMTRVRAVEPTTYADDLYARLLRDSVQKPAATQKVNSFRENVAAIQGCGLLGPGL